MSIVLDAKDFKETNLNAKDVKEGNQHGSLGDVGSTVLGSGSSNGTGSSGNVGSIGYVGSFGNVGSLGNAGSIGNLANSENAGSTGNLIEEKNLPEAKNLEESKKLAISSGTLGNLGLSSTTAIECPINPPVYRTYGYRWIILLLYAGISNAGGVLGVTCAPIITNLQSIYGVSFNVVNLSTLVGMILYIPATIPGNYILDTYGIKKGLIVGTALTLLGGWVRMLAGSSFSFVLLGQILAALGGPLIANCPQKISAYWNSPKQRTMFTVMLMLTGVVGGSVGFLLPGYIVGEESSPELGKKLFLRLLLIEAIVATVLCVPLFFFFREKPPTPPSASATMPRANFKKGIKLLFTNKNFLWLLGQQGCVLGAINTLATVMQSLIDPFGYTQVQAANLGVIINVASVVGCLSLGMLVEKTKKFSFSIIISSIVGLAAYGMFLGVLYSHNFAILAVIAAVLAFVLSPSGPVALEFGCELTFPVGEALAGGAILSVIQIFCPAQTFAIGAIMGMEDKRKASVYSIVMLIGFMAVGFFCSLFVKQNLVRSAHDKLHNEQAAAAAAAMKAGENNAETPHPLVNNPESSPSPNKI